jgi:rRNA biogenesis protein RRP5
LRIPLSVKILSIIDTLCVDVDLQMSEVSKVTSVLPGMLVQCLVTAVQSTGLNVQIMGFFDGTVDQYHLLPGPIEKNYKLGRKLKARVLYGIASTSPKFALSLANHVIHLVPRSVRGGDEAGPPASLQEAYPVGTVLDAVKVIRVEAAQGLVVQVQADVQGFIHVSLFKL